MQYSECAWLPKWEYLVESYESFDERSIQSDLNRFGKEGWDLVSVSTSLRTYIFKRLVVPGG